jgi:hypothetical protein
MPKCKWCNKEHEQVKEISVLTKGWNWIPLQDGKAFVCPEHEEKFRKFDGRIRRYNPLFIVLCGLFILMLVVSAFGLDSNNYLYGYLFIISFALLGLVIVVFPF